MGTTIDKIIVVWGHNDEDVARVHKKAIEIFGVSDTRNGTESGSLFSDLISNVVHCMINNGACFVIGPDGSKLGWETAELAAKCRTEFISWLRKEKKHNNFDFFVNWVLISEASPFEENDCKHLIEDQNDPTEE